MINTYGTKYSTEASATAYDEVICQHENDPVWPAEQELLRGLIRRYVPKPAEARTLDFACGSGRILKVLQPVVGELVGLDISAAMLERARVRVPGVSLVQADIVANPEAVPGEFDIVTAFRFLLLAEPTLREACLRVLASHVRADRGVLILNSHGNPMSFRFVSSLCNTILRRGTKLPRFSRQDMKNLASQCGLDLVSTTGCGFIPRTVQRVLPASLCQYIERAFAGFPLLLRFGTNLLFVLRPSSLNRGALNG